MKKLFHSRKRYWLPLVVGLAMLPVPLLRDFHIESALLVALVGCFWSAWRSCERQPAQNDIRRIGSILTKLYLIGFPLFVYAFIRGCLGWHSIGFWILYPVPSVLLGYALGRLLRLWKVSARRFVAMAALAFVALGVLIFELLNFPQVYFFNHVWGGWPGPIYDETVKVTRSLVFFRVLTLLWAGLFWLLPGLNKSTGKKIGIAACLLALIAGYIRLGEMGIISPRSYLQEQLQGVKQTAHFTLYYDTDHYSKDEIEFIAQKHEFYFDQITNQLEIEWPDKANRIESYLYAHPWQKKKLVGAKFTSYVPVWLDQDQLHIAKPQIEGSLKHELVHVLAKQFGNRLFNASWSIGLVEGLAVAVAPDESRLTTIDQIVVSEKPYPTAREMEKAIAPLGFYGGRSAVNYTQTGSFVQYLLQNYPVGKFKEAYRSGSIADAYDVKMEQLINGWHQKLDTVSVDSVDQRIAQRLYGFPSLFEQECPHVQSDFARIWDGYQLHIAERDTVQALEYLDQARKESPENLFVKVRWAFLNLKAGNIKKVQAAACQSDSSIEGLLLYADGFALKGKTDKANGFITEAAQRLQVQPDTLLQAAVEVRQDSLQWYYHRQLVYGGDGISDSIFTTLHDRTRAKAIEQTIKKEKWEQLALYAERTDNSPFPDLRYFDTYLNLTAYLAFHGYHDLARHWVDQLKALPLRARYAERLQQAEEWVEFIEF